MRILVVEDEKNLNTLIVNFLKKMGYSVDSCTDGVDAWGYINNTEYDSILLNTDSPKKNGLEILTELRKKGSRTPVMLLTAKTAIEDLVRGLDLGADDYMTKPVNLDELLARTRAMIRKHTRNCSNLYSYADLSLDCNTHIVTRGGKSIQLSNKEFSILEILMANKGMVLSRQKIEQHVCDYDYDGCSNVIDVYIRYLRKKIDDEYSHKLIHTIRGVGYVLREELQ